MRATKRQLYFTDTSKPSLVSYAEPETLPRLPHQIVCPILQGLLPPPDVKMYLTGSSGEHSLLRTEPATLMLSIAWLVLRLFWETMVQFMTILLLFIIYTPTAVSSHSPFEMAALTVHIAHGKAAFFSWHRRFISVYEQYLKDKCSYTGALPYVS